MAFAKHVEHLALITDVTKALNALPERNDDVGYYIYVELREAHTHKKAGMWSDEISGKDWSYEDNPEF